MEEPEICDGYGMMEQAADLIEVYFAALKLCFDAYNHHLRAKLIVAPAAGGKQRHMTQENWRTLSITYCYVQRGSI